MRERGRWEYETKGECEGLLEKVSEEVGGGDECLIGEEWTMMSYSRLYGDGDPTNTICYKWWQWRQQEEDGAKGIIPLDIWRVEKEENMVHWLEW